jgi:hypothetical protein
VSGFVKKQLPMLLVSQMGGGSSGNSSNSNSSGSSVSVQDALRATFLEVDANLAASTIDCEFSGCTCAVAHLQVRTCGVALCCCSDQSLLLRDHKTLESFTSHGLQLLTLSAVLRCLWCPEAAGACFTHPH